jgi:hypothetical protein
VGAAFCLLTAFLGFGLHKPGERGGAGGFCLHGYTGTGQDGASLVRFRFVILLSRNAIRNVFHSFP